MKHSGLTLGCTALALILSLNAPALAQDIDFGDDSSRWANNDQCDDPRFEGPGAATFRSPVDEMRDATDCQTAFEAGEVTLVAESADDTDAAPTADAGDIDFGDDSGAWANDGECDDPRFGGALASHEFADATDCREAFEAGDVTYSGDADSAATGGETAAGDIDFGDDSGTWANDGECDDPRFGGALASHEFADATDCRQAYEAGEVTYSGDQAAPATGGDVSADDIDFGDDSGTWANDGECDDPRFGGGLTSHELADATDCREAFEAGEVTYSGSAAATSETPVSIDDIDFGDDSGTWANDGECDDPRFGGGLTSHEFADATDCREAYEAGIVTYSGEGAASTGTSTAIGDIDFGDDSGTYANDGECDDARFTGAGMGASLDSHIMADATDCRTAFEDGTITLLDDAGSSASTGDIDFGDDSGTYANDGECDDARFTGPGMGASLDSHIMADATDCRTAFEDGTITLADGNGGGSSSASIVIDGIDFGDDSGNWANDGECDDPRFSGSGVGVALDDHLMADATDCSTAYQAGTVTLDEDGGNGSASDFRINFGDNSSATANDGVCDDPRFQGRGGAMELLEANILSDAADCRAAYEAGTVTYNP